MEQSDFKTSTAFNKFKNDKNVQLYYLSEQNNVYSQYESLNIALNLYITKLTEMNSMTDSQMKGNLPVQTLLPTKATDYKPSYYEQTLFFLVENGNRYLRQFVIEASSYYSRESEEHAEQNITSTKVTAIVSIIAIVIVSLAIAPILTKAEIRRYKALLYFLKIPKDKLPNLIKNCEYCLNMNDEKRYFQI